jgi:hypothetical protein
MFTRASHFIATIAEHKVAKTEPDIKCDRRTNDLDRICFYLFVAGGIAGLAQFSHPLPFGLGYEMVAIGKTLATSGSFANPFRILDTGPTAVNPPLYPFFLGLLFKLFGAPGFVLIAAAIGNIVMNALAASWLPRVSLVAFGSIVPGVVASILWLAAVQLMPAWDTSYTAAGLILFCWRSASSIKSNRPLKAAVSSGLLAGALMLLNPSSVIVLLAWLAYLTVAKQRSLLFAGVVLAISCVPVSLWMLRNVMVLGAPVLRTNLGMTLHVSNNDCAQPSLVTSGQVGCYQSNHPNDSLVEAQALRSQGEVTYDKTRVADSIRWMRSNPTRFRQLTIERLRLFWFPQHGKRALPTYAIWFGTVLSIPGFLLMVGRREAVTGFIAFVLFIYPLMYYVVVSDVRYRYPVLWVSFLAAGYLVLSAKPSRAGQVNSSRGVAESVSEQVPASADRT